jgi:hypothetical protein
MRKSNPIFLISNLKCRIRPISRLSDFEIPEDSDYCVGVLLLFAEERTAIWVGLKTCTTRCVVC